MTNAPQFSPHVLVYYILNARCQNISSLQIQSLHKRVLWRREILQEIRVQIFLEKWIIFLSQNHGQVTWILHPSAAVFDLYAHSIVFLEAKSKNKILTIF